MQEQYLHRLNSVFARVDADQDGVISEVEFKSLISLLQKEFELIPEGEIQAETQRLLEQVDPHCN